MTFDEFGPAVFIAVVVLFLVYIRSRDKKLGARGDRSGGGDDGGGWFDSDSDGGGGDGGGGGD